MDEVKCGEGYLLKEDIGTKARNLLILKQKGFNVPDLFTIPAKNVSLNNIGMLAKTIADRTCGKNLSFIIRSSALGEDTLENSFAGIFESPLLSNPFRELS